MRSYAKENSLIARGLSSALRAFRAFCACSLQMDQHCRLPAEQSVVSPAALPQPAVPFRVAAHNRKALPMVSIHGRFLDSVILRSCHSQRLERITVASFLLPAVRHAGRLGFERGFGLRRPFGLRWHWQARGDRLSFFLFRWRGQNRIGDGLLGHRCYYRSRQLLAVRLAGLLAVRGYWTSQRIANPAPMQSASAIGTTV
jgi:hypothetical protein